MQVALALVLIVSAALMIRTFQALRGVDAGFSNPATIQTAGISIPFRLVSDPEPGATAARKNGILVIFLLLITDPSYWIVREQERHHGDDIPGKA